MQDNIVKAKKSKLSVMLCSALAVCALSLSGCGTLEPEAQADTAQAFGHLTQTSESYAELADKSSGEGRFNALILLARSQITAGNLDDAASTIADLKDRAETPLQRDEASIIEALMLSRSGNNPAAAGILSKLNSNAMSESLARYFLLLKFSVNEKAYLKTRQSGYAENAYVSAVNLLPLLAGEDRNTISRRAVDFVESAGCDSLNQKLERSGSDLDRGFYEYAQIDASTSSDAKQKLFADFKTRHPDHPLTALIGETAAPAASAAAETVPQSPAQSAGNVIAVPAERGEIVPVDSQGIFSVDPDAKVAVLLPLSGRHARTVGESAKLGIMASLQDHKSRLQVTFYDTAKNSVESIVETLRANGTALIVGPILKEDLNALNASGLDLPTIALNTPEGQRPAKEWYFDLSPDYEGALAAAKVKADGFAAPVVIASSDRASQRSASAFAKNFGASARICNVDPANGTQSARACNAATADAAYVTGSATDAVNFKAGLPATVQVYLTDSSYEGFNNSGQQLALRGAKLGDMPWLLSDSGLKDSFMKSIPKANSMAQRIFCAGYDAVSLALAMPELAKDNQDVLHGLTGDISLGQNGLIETAPLWVNLGEIRN